MKLPVVAIEEMSHPIIHHFKKAKIIQPHTSKYCQFHRISHQEYISNNTIRPCTSKFGQFHRKLSSRHILQRIFPKMNCSYTHLKNKIKQSSITANAAIHVIRTDCYQHQRKRNHDEITNSCHRRNVASHNPSFQKSKNHSAAHIEILSISSHFTSRIYIQQHDSAMHIKIWSISS